MKKKLTLIILSILIIITGVVGISYAYWQTTKVSTTNNLLKSSCFKLEIQQESDSITLNKAYPITDEEALEGSVSPYYFILKNTCDLPAIYDVNLEVLPSSTLDSKYIKSYTTASSEFKLLNEYELMDSTIIEDAKEGRILASEKLMPGESSMFGIALWLDENTPAIPETINQTFESKITLNGNVHNDFVTINLDADGGELETNQLASLEGNTYGDLPTPVKKGYLFSHWYLDNVENEITSDTIIEGKNNIVLKAAYDDLSNISLIKNYAFNDLEDFYTEVTTIRPYDTTPSEDILLNAVDISDYLSINKVYVWMEDSILYYYSDKDIYLQNDKFKNYNNLTNIDLSIINTLYMTSTADMFSECNKLTNLDLSNFNTSNVTNMSNMFKNCKSLERLNINGFNTEKVIDMSAMFNGCENLNILNIINFNTSNVTDMSYMFVNCSSLEELDLSSFNTSKVTNMRWMFSNCSLLKDLDISMFDTTNVYSMQYMFNRCESIIQLDLSNFNTINLRDMRNMFYYCKSLKSINLTNFNTSNVEFMTSLFDNCQELEKVDVSGFYAPELYNMSYMFNNCQKLTKIDLSNLNAKKLSSTARAFDNCESLEQLNISNINTSKVKDMSYMFYHCVKLRSLDVSHFNTSSVDNMGGMFTDCESLTELDLSSFNTSNVTDMSWMFYGCDNIKRLDLSNFNTEKVTEFKDILPLFTLEELILDCESASNLKSFIDNDNVYKLYISYTCI